MSRPATKPSLIEAIRTDRHLNGPPCGFIALYAKLETVGLAGEFDQLMAKDSGETTAAIARILHDVNRKHDLGLPLALHPNADRQMLQRHRNDWCGCAR